MDFEKKKTIMEHNFVFSLWKNPRLYSKYINKIEKMEKLFDNKDANFFYVIGKQMYKAGFEHFDEASVLSFVSGNDVIKDAFIKKGGYSVYEAAKSHLEGDNAEGYFNEVIKINCLNDLQNNGINIDNDYPKLAQMSVDQIKMFYSHKLNNIFLTKSSTTHIDDMEITDDDLELLNSGAQMGLSIASVAPLLNYEILGINRGLSFIGGAVNQGKAQPLYAKVYTQHGESTIGALKVGDKVYGEDGKLHNVTGIFDRGIKKNYRVTFQDGSCTECCDEHLWNINKSTFKNKNKFITVELKDIINDPIGLRKTIRDGYRYSIPEHKPIEMIGVNHIIQPYLLGCLIGDGCLTGKTIELSNSEEDVIRKCERLLPNGYSIKKNSDLNYSWNIVKPQHTYKSILISEIKRMGLNKLSHEKFIPNEYKYDSIENRLELLRGLFDTDGNVNGRCNNYSITTTSHQLKDDILWLTRSLGMLSSATQEKRNQYASGVCYTISIRFNEDMLPFSSEKHLKKYKPNKRNKSLRRKITKIEYIGEEHMKCIMVDNPTHLYLTDNFIVTHNTAFCCGVVVKGFISQGIRTVIISNEQTLMEFKQLFLAMAVNEIKEQVDRRRIKIGHYGSKEWEVLRAAKDYYNTYYAPFFKFAKIFDYSLEDVQTIINTMSARGYKGFIYDVFKAEDGTTGRVVEEMKEMSKALFKTADETDSYVVATIQLGLSFSDVRNLHMGVISTSKHITEPATEVLLIREMWDDECTGEKNDIKIYNYKYDRDGNKMIDKATGKPIKQYIEVYGEDYRQIKLLFVAKTRNTDRGICIAYRFDGAYNEWKEIGYCTPSYENRNSNKKG